MPVVDATFVRGLTTAVVEHSLINNQKAAVSVSEQKTKAGCLLLTRYISNEELELQCLFAIQVLIVKLEHPFGKWLVCLHQSPSLFNIYRLKSA